MKPTIAHEMPTAIIVMADGRWNDAELEINSKGTEQAPITLRAQTPGKVLLTGKSSLRIGGEYNVVDGLHFLPKARQGAADVPVLGGELSGGFKVSHGTDLLHVGSRTPPGILAEPFYPIRAETKEGETAKKGGPISGPDGPCGGTWPGPPGAGYPPRFDLPAGCGRCPRWP